MEEQKPSQLQKVTNCWSDGKDHNEPDSPQNDSQTMTEDLSSSLDSDCPTLDFIRQYQAMEITIDGVQDCTLYQQVDMKTVVRKIDKKLLLLALLLYFLQFLDKVVLNYSKIMGISKDLHLKGNQFSDLPTYFFVAFLIFEPIQGLLLHRFTIVTVLSVNVVIWGITTACCSAARNFPGIMVLRVILGCSEAAISPCLVLLTTTWYNSSESAFRMGIWYSGLGLGQIVGGLLSFLFQLVPTDLSFNGWRIMFLVVGIANVACGLGSYFMLPNGPVNCKFLNIHEKYALLVKLTDSKVGGASKKIVWHQVWESLSDVTFYLFFLLSASISFSSNTISTFSSTDIISFGFTPKHAALLNMPSGVVSIISTLLSAYFIMKGFPRGLSIMLLCLPAVTGGALMSFLPKHNQAGLLVGIYMINTIVAPLAIVYAWIGSCVAGHTKKVCFNISVMIGFAVGNITGPQSYRVKDAPQYLPAKISMLVTQAVSVVIAFAILITYFYRNKQRDHSQVDIEVDDKEEMENVWSNKTDFENPYFRYCY
ncbi:unnamed protein product [Ambrosiozyma monospora]|uniref:Unnamed protein product n=1 Tax=Ambrosiozyma monospora TaxID=43982 RepID=A0A9W6YUH9_AMBMO|nr:unnamed protein product [Ambrosiozyma monospora]